MGLELYHSKRDFSRTPEPRGKVSRSNKHRFVVQEHHASMLHFDFRLEMGGVLKSWSVRKGPSLDPREKRLAVPTEDHPVEYLYFEGHIPAGNYGAGEHMVWDTGTYQIVGSTDPLKQLAAGKLKFRLQGRKLKGEFNLVKMSGRDNQWLLMKSRDEFAEEGWQLEQRLKTDSAGSNKTRKKRAATNAGRATGKIVKQQQAKRTGAALPASRVFKQRELSGSIEVKIGKEIIHLTNLDKIYWPDEGYTKGDLIRYYYEVSKFIQPYLKDRPLIMKRYPGGIRGLSFHQHDVDQAPEFVRTEAIDVVEGHAVDYIIGDNLPTLVYMANLGAIERHPWHSRVRKIDYPDWFVFDLDPGPGVEFTTICQLALSVRDMLEQLGLKAYAKTSGSRGIHVYVPLKAIYSYEEVAEFALQVATLVADENPLVATVERSLKKRRRGQIYIDHMQNARGKSVVAPYSVRPKPGALVSAPLKWGEVERRKIRLEDFNIKTMLRRIAREGELFRPVLKHKQSLGHAMKRLQTMTDEAKARASKA